MTKLIFFDCISMVTAEAFEWYPTFEIPSTTFQTAIKRMPNVMRKQYYNTDNFQSFVGNYWFKF